jgi:hypothetical protein
MWPTLEFATIMADELLDGFAAWSSNGVFAFAFVEVDAAVLFPGVRASHRTTVSHDYTNVQCGPRGWTSIRLR